MADSGAVLGDYVSLLRGSTYKSRLLGQPGPVLLGLASIARNGGFRDDNLKTYGGESPEQLILKPGDLFVSLKDVTQAGDLLGAVARVPRNVSLGRLTQDTVKLIFKDEEASREYIYWLLRTPQYRAYCRAHAIGTTNLALNREDFLAFPVPELTPQRRLAIDILEACEKAIHLNWQATRTLEQLARSIFKAWFVDFEPVKAKAAGELSFPSLSQAVFEALPNRLVPTESGLGSIPEGWSVGAMGDIGQQRREQVQPEELAERTPYIGLEHLPRRSITLSEWGTADAVTSAKSRFETGEILFGKLRPYFHKVGLAPVDGVCSTDIVVLSARKPMWAAWLLMLVSSDAFVAHADRASAGTKMPRTNWNDMARFPIALPPEHTAAAFQDTVGPMLTLIRSAIHENRALVAIRDALLPRLISGLVNARTSVMVEVNAP